MHITFDTLEMVRRLEAKGFKREQAEEIISVVKDVQQELATKSDIEVLRKDIEVLRREVKTDIEVLRRDMVIKISSITFVLLLAFKVFDKFI